MYQDTAATKILEIFSPIEKAFSIGENISNILVAAVSWYTPHPACDKLGKPAEVWCNSVSEVSAPRFIPLLSLNYSCIPLYTVHVYMQHIMAHSGGEQCTVECRNW